MVVAGGNEFISNFRDLSRSRELSPSLTNQFESNLRVHGLDVLGVGPEAVVDRGEGDASGPEVERGEHHVRAGQ